MTQSTDPIDLMKTQKEMEKYRQVLVDPGRYAVYKGYDAIDVPSN